jgi:hypothetical protein
MASNATAGASGGGAAGGAATTKASGLLGGVNADDENELLSNYLFIVLGSISIALIGWRFTTVLVKYVRTVSCLNNETQRYFAQTSGRMAWFKKNILYSPIFSKRHNREFQMSKAINVGTLPTRMQLFFLLGYFATNVAFCLLLIDFSQPMATVAPILRNRSGTLATVNMIPLILMAGRNNPLIKMLGISFDTFNLLHRWFGRIVVLETVCHVLAWFIPSASTKGWASAFNTVVSVPYLLYGFIVSIAPHPQRCDGQCLLC